MSADQDIPVVVYAARSVDNTANDETGQQIAAVNARVEREGGRRIVGVFDEAGVSGSKGNRGPQLEAAMARAIELADAHPVVELWTWASNRLARGTGRKGEARSVNEVLTYLLRHG